ncbi:hypothetical protein acdb102_23320 [Acidothermaceae bacterium B102]|nr:hypothetical protein acdb102_23320 [Acidothermaceae bacterium B102]
MILAAETDRIQRTPRECIARTAPPLQDLPVSAGHADNQPGLDVANGGSGGQAHARATSDTSTLVGPWSLDQLGTRARPHAVIPTSAFLPARDWQEGSSEAASAAVASRTGLIAVDGGSR